MEQKSPKTKVRYTLIKVEKTEPLIENGIVNQEKIIITALFSCYGMIETTRKVYTKRQWNSIVSKEYYEE